MNKNNKKLKLLSIVGARPNFIKMEPIFKEIQTRGLEHVLLHTGQHYDKQMSKIFIEEMEIPEPDYVLGVGSGSHGFQTGEMIKRIETVLVKEKPDIVLVPGDTNSTLAGAIATTKLNIPLAHIEAGLRSFDRRMPEEKNRILVDHCSDFLFCPTTTAVDNLLKEGIEEERIFLSGDTMVAACKQNLKIAKRTSHLLGEYQLPGEYVLITIHRAENTDNYDNLRQICEILKRIDMNVIFPIHPRTKKRLEEYGLLKELKMENLYVLPPLGYLDFLFVLSKCDLVITDSGGLQKEAFILKKPCITLRSSTEWVETVETGANKLVGIDVDETLNSIDTMKNFNFGNIRNPFGTINASKKIIDFLIKKIRL